MQRLEIDKNVLPILNTKVSECTVKLVVLNNEDTHALFVVKSGKSLAIQFKMNVNDNLDDEIRDYLKANLNLDLMCCFIEEVKCNYNTMCIVVNSVVETFYTLDLSNGDYIGHSPDLCELTRYKGGW
ncbi:hypothetical protein D3C81_07730 [compost metagenome]